MIKGGGNKTGPCLQFANASAAPHCRDMSFFKTGTILIGTTLLARRYSLSITGNSNDFSLAFYFVCISWSTFLMLIWKIETNIMATLRASLQANTVNDTRRTEQPTQLARRRQSVVVRTLRPSRVSVFFQLTLLPLAWKFFRFEKRMKHVPWIAKDAAKRK